MDVAGSSFLYSSFFGLYPTIANRYRRLGEQPVERVLKVFCSGPEQDRHSEKIPVFERYAAFVLARMTSGLGSSPQRIALVVDIAEREHHHLRGTRCGACPVGFMV